MQSWDEVRRWRREQRARLIAERQALPQNERQRLQAPIIDRLEAHFPDPARELIGFYWPFRGEIGLHGLVRRLVELGAGAALPVVVEKRRPLEFWAWRPGDRLERGVWDIPVPAERRVVQPTTLLVPLVGFDGEAYRLGYGGGYYDRTLAVMDPRPLTIGVGYELARLPTIHPQPHDVPMDTIVTEAGVFKSPASRDRGAGRTSPPDWDEDPNNTGTYASPPCFMHELDPSYLGVQHDHNPAPADQEGESAKDPGNDGRTRNRKPPGG